jgi:hypothetical protein
MIPPLPDTLGASPNDRFKRFASAILAVPKTDIETPEQAIARLQAEKRRIEAKIAAVKREKAMRKAQKPSSHIA